MKLIQVFNYSDMPASLVDKFLEDNDVNNDSYVRFYPNDINHDYEKEIVEWLLKDGMVKEDNYLFYVLINVSW